MQEFKDEKTQDWISIWQVFLKYYVLIKSQVISFSCWLKLKWKQVTNDRYFVQKANNLDGEIFEITKEDFRNKNNLGGFRNKYNAVKNSTCEWVYLLDSDNHPYDTTLDIIQSIENPDSNICYSPQTLLLHQEDTPTTYDSKTYNFRYNLIGIDDAQDAIFKKTYLFDWFLNTGNFVVNREKYLERLLNGYNNLKEPVYACSVAFSYHWMSNGGLYKIIPNMKYYHRVRGDSYWVSCGTNSQLSVDYYNDKLVNLKW